MYSCLLSSLAERVQRLLLRWVEQQERSALQVYDVAKTSLMTLKASRATAALAIHCTSRPKSPIMLVHPSWSWSLSWSHQATVTQCTTMAFDG